MVNILKLKHGDGVITLHPDGTVDLKGNVKDAAMALATHVFEERSDGIVDITFNRTLKAHCKKGEPFTLHWETKGTFTDNGWPAPWFFNALKTEFERVCKMKAFL